MSTIAYRIVAGSRLIAGLALTLLAWSAAAADPSPIRSIDVTKDSDAYVADIVMFAPVPAGIAWAVLTDFDHMANWVPNVRESKVLSSEGNMLTIEQQGVAKFGLAQFPYTSVRQMTLDPQNSVRVKQIKGSMKRLESLMNVSPEGNGTQLKYHLEVVPSGLAAAVMSKEFLQHEMTEQFTAIIQEMVRRSR